MRNLPGHSLLGLDLKLGLRMGTAVAELFVPRVELGVGPRSQLPVLSRRDVGLAFSVASVENAGRVEDAPLGPFGVLVLVAILEADPNCGVGRVFVDSGQAFNRVAFFRLAVRNPSVDAVDFGRAGTGDLDVSGEA